MTDFSLEKAAMARGCAAVCGCDEAGAGPLMGPVYAAAVILPVDGCIPGLNDSKKLTEKKREALFDVICQQAAAWAVASVSAEEIDATDILSARMKAMQLAINALAIPADYALIDGNRDHGRSAAINTGQGESGPVCVPGTGLSVPAVSVRQTQGLRHQAALRHAGSIRAMSGAPDELSHQVEGAAHMSRAEGVWGEAQIANYLRCRRYELLAHSYHCRFGEIDLIARKGGVLCFVEVKTRSNLACGLPREYVTAAKQERIRKTAAFYLMEKGLDCPVRFDVAEVYTDGAHSPAATHIEYIENAF